MLPLHAVPSRGGRQLYRRLKLSLFQTPTGVQYKRLPGYQRVQLEFLFCKFQLLKFEEVEKAVYSSIITFLDYSGGCASGGCDNGGCDKHRCDRAGLR